MSLQCVVPWADALDVFAVSVMHPHMSYQLSKCHVRTQARTRVHVTQQHDTCATCVQVQHIFIYAYSQIHTHVFTQPHPHTLIKKYMRICLHFYMHSCTHTCADPSHKQKNTCAQVHICLSRTCRCMLTHSAGLGPCSFVQIDIRSLTHTYTHTHAENAYVHMKTPTFTHARTHVYINTRIMKYTCMQGHVCSQCMCKYICIHS